jgi:hypothetical protein
MSADIYAANFLTMRINSDRPVACIGNPPFGKNAKLAISFFNHAASQSDVIAFILSRTFRKTATINRLDDRFHLAHEELVPANAFIFEGKTRSVPTVFQIWVRQESRRAQLQIIRTHPDFKFTSRAKADFAIQRVGKRAGRVHHELWRSGQAHYFIEGDVEDVMKDLGPAFTTVAQDTAGMPSLAKSEIVSMYSERTSSSSRTAR